MVYLIGVYHTLQWDRKKCKISGLEKYLIFYIKKYSIQLIAEEFYTNYDPNNPAKSSINEIAKEQSIQYLDCDLDLFTQEKIGNSASIRENYWLKKLEQYLEKNIIFLCGYNHLNSFKKVLSSRGIAIKILKTFKKTSDI